MKDWARSLLEERRYAVLGTQDPDGTPHLTPVWYLFRDDELFIDAESFSRKVRNIKTNPRVSFVIDVRDPGTERWVAGLGPATIVDGADAQRINREIFERYLTPEALSHEALGPAFAGANDVTIRVRPEQWRSWSAIELDEQYFGGLIGTDPAKWFRPVD